MTPIELIFQLWLKSIGAYITLTPISYLFVYRNRDYMFLERNDCSGGGLDIGDISPSGTWLDVNLDITNIDINDPSFDPDAVFKPFKDCLDKIAEI